VDAHAQPGIRFRGVHLLDLHFEIHGPLPQRLPTGIRFDVAARILRETKTLEVVLKVDLFGGLRKDEMPPMEFRFALVGRFAEAETPNMDLGEFARRHAAAFLVPYARELIANITARSPLPTLNIGPINVLALVEQGQATLVIEYDGKPDAPDACSNAPQSGQGGPEGVLPGRGGLGQPH
jgi:preprotein translocase subunit SecB